MGVKYGDFSFDKGFGFTGSAGPGYARGGSVQPKGMSKEPTITMPVSTAQTVAKGLTAIGAQHGAAAAAGALRGPTVGGPMSATPGPQAPSMQPGGGAPPPGPGPAMMAKGGHMNAAKRNALPSADFAGPDRSYPIPNASHARNALARASGKPVEARVRAAVHRKFPDIGSK